ncbi:hypothetical protein L211DRAFT_577331 [Terfezia boudieri ATCC MYA-4762]|uniref:Uncharacterized protein n=1 Tax=Terfezia boudieri ATCC MYA-4762 TaxID=1051890 RepID=A0A3N4LB21_9PEZI|nr:hypothetical protein L211DRAFT_577331 [Terfezia boudieri ATCC MYA-4762]
MPPQHLLWRLSRLQPPLSSSSFPRILRHASSRRRAQHTRPYTRLPPRIQRLAAPLREAPVSHITAFLVLHEITAVLPLGCLWWGIHSFGVVPFRFGSPDAGGLEEEGNGNGVSGRVRRKWREWVKSGEARLGSYITKKGWLAGLSPAEAARVVVELGTAWAVVKVLLPVRVVACLWMTPCLLKYGPKGYELLFVLYNSG